MKEKMNKTNESIALLVFEKKFCEVEELSQFAQERAGTVREFLIGEEVTTDVGEEKQPRGAGWVERITDRLDRIVLLLRSTNNDLQAIVNAGFAPLPPPEPIRPDAPLREDEQYLASAREPEAKRKPTAEEEHFADVEKTHGVTIAAELAAEKDYSLEEGKQAPDVGESVDRNSKSPSVACNRTRV